MHLLCHGQLVGASWKPLDRPSWTKLTGTGGSTVQIQSANLKSMLNDINALVIYKINQIAATDSSQDTRIDFYDRYVYTKSNIIK